MSSPLAKKVLALSLAVFIIFTTFTSPTIAQGTSIRLVINGEEVVPDAPPFIKDSRTLVPIRIISERLGAKVVWDPNKREVFITYGSINILLTVGSKTAIVNGKNITLDVPAEINNGRTFVPLRFVGEAMGAEVQWDGNSRTASVSQNTRITNVALGQHNGVPAIIVTGDKRLTYSSFNLSNPERIVIDFNNALMAVTNTAFDVNNQGIRRVRISQFEVNPNKTRIVLDMDKALGHRIIPINDNSVAISIEPLVERVEVSRTGDVISKIFLSQPMTYNVSELTAPDRLVIDIHGGVIRSGPNNFAVNDHQISRVRVSQFSNDPNIVRVVYDLKERFSYVVRQDINGNLEVAFGNLLTAFDFRSEERGTRVNLLTSALAEYNVTVTGNRMEIVLPKTDVSFPLNNSPVNTTTLSNIKINKRDMDTVVTLEMPYYWRHNISQNGTMISILLEKSPLDGKLIVVDPGHGGASPGVVVNKVMEKDLVLDISLRLEPLLRALGANVFMIRTTDIDIDHRIRVGIANSINADLFISVHINGFTNTSINGIETLFTNKDNGVSRTLAQTLQNSLVSRLGMHNRGLFDRPNIVVIRETIMPAALVEIGYLTNPGDFAKVTQPLFRQQAAEALAQGILNYYTR
jgi:N-acetylmuramoyl-L-alanine amidase